MKAFFIFLFSGMSALSFSQNHPAPLPEGGTGNEEVLACIEWLQETPISQSLDSRRTVNAYLLQWISRSPNVHVELRPGIVDMATNNPDLLPVYVGGWVRYSLESGEEYPSIEAHIEGMRAVVKFYSANREGLNYDRYLEKLIKQEKKGNMEKFLSKNGD